MRFHTKNECVDPIHPIVTLRDGCTDPRCERPVHYTYLTTDDEWIFIDVEGVGGLS